MLFKVFTIMTLAIAIPYSVIAKESFDEKVTGTPALSGHVQSSSSNIPGPRQVNIFTPEGFLIVSDATNVHGYYSYDGSMPSEVYVTTTYGGSIDELWPDIPCLHGNCDLTKGTLVDLSSGNRTIDFTLEPWTDPVFQSGFELI